MLVFKDLLRQIRRIWLLRYFLIRSFWVSCISSCLIIGWGWGRILGSQPGRMEMGREEWHEEWTWLTTNCRWLQLQINLAHQNSSLQMQSSTTKCSPTWKYNSTRRSTISSTTNDLNYKFPITPFKLSLKSFLNPFNHFNYPLRLFWLSYWSFRYTFN